MKRILIYTDNNEAEIKRLCNNAAEAEIIVKPAGELLNTENENADAAVTDISEEKLKEISRIMTFSIPILYVANQKPSDLRVRSEAFDFVVKPIDEYEFSNRLKNLIKIKSLKDKILTVSATDELTGLYNRKILAERIESEIARAKRYKTPLSCVLFDLDFFKTVNDMYGYESGDKLLKKTAQLLLESARKEDFVTRYGDEEFLVLLPSTTESNAFVFAERFRRDIEKMSFIPDGEDERHPVKISGGIATFPYLDNYDDNADSLIRYAEHALYNAKSHGKNRVIMFSQINTDF